MYYEKENYSIKKNLEEKLDLTSFTKLDNENNVKNQKYNLYGVITKIRENCKNKYVASCKNSEDDNWYRFDDENIHIVENINHVVNYGIPLILFYSKVE